MFQRVFIAPETHTAPQRRPPTKQTEPRLHNQTQQTNHTTASTQRLSNTEGHAVCHFNTFKLLVDFTTNPQDTFTQYEKKNWLCKRKQQHVRGALTILETYLLQKNMSENYILILKIQTFHETLDDLQPLFPKAHSET